MAVIKIVPMPGAVGDKGDEGAVGPRGQQGERGLQGVPGADALWSYNGEYNPGAGYAVGDVVTYNGQLWYRKNSNGGNVGDTPSEGLFWDLLAAKGADSIAPTSGTWDTKFRINNGIIGKQTEDQSRIGTLGTYRTIGDVVFFDMNIGAQASNWGTSIVWQIDLPFPIHNNGNGINGQGAFGHVFTGRLIGYADDIPLSTSFPYEYAADETANIPIYLFCYTTPGGETKGYIRAVDFESINERTENFRSVNSNWPLNLSGTVENSQIDPNALNSIRFHFNGSYIKA